MSRDEIIARIDQFLACVARRDLAQARQYLAPDACIVFPPSRTFNSLEDMAASMRARYRTIDKVRQRWDIWTRDDGATVVYNSGTLFGVNLHGVPFSDVRYLDRFELREGLIVRHEVWNDLAESGVLERTE
ncbi:MAG TPA: nuclear transport factor 2 family protein [Chloroflexota bacterium]